MRFELLKTYLVDFGNFITEKIIIFDYWNYWGCGKIMEFWYILCSIEIWIIENLFGCFGNFVVEKIIIFGYWNYWGVGKLWHFDMIVISMIFGLDGNFYWILWYLWRRIINLIAFHLHHGCVKENKNCEKCMKWKKKEK